MFFFFPLYNHFGFQMIHDLTGKSWREVYSMAAFYMWPRYFGELVKVNISKTKSLIMKVISKNISISFH